MEWFDAAEDPALCDGPMGAVSQGETVARLLHETTIEPDKNRFPRKELFAVKLQTPSHVCAKKDGASVDRCDDLDDDEINRRSEVQAGRKPDRSACGAHFATVDDVRSLRLPDDADRQIFKVYDDARLVADEYGEANLEHAVIRGDAALTRAQQSGAIDLIIKLFRPTRPKVEPPAPATF